MLNALRAAWRYMLTPPWRPLSDEPKYSKPLHVLLWLLGWLYALAGLVGGALLSPALLDRLDLRGTPYQDYVVIGVSALTGFGAQLAAWVFLFVYGAIWFVMYKVSTPAAKAIKLPVISEDKYFVEVGGAHIPGIFLLLFVLQAVLVVFAVLSQLTQPGVQQDFLATGVIGGLVVKMASGFLVNTVFAGLLIKPFLHWIRGGKKEKAN